MGESLFILQPRLSRPGGVRTAPNLAGEFQRRGHPVTLPVGEFPPSAPLSHSSRREGRDGATHQAMAVASISIRYSREASRVTPSSVLAGLQLPFSSRIISASQLLSNSSTSVV